MCEHDREIEWIKPKPRQRRPYFQIYCTECGAQSALYRLPGHAIDADGYPVELAQACDDVLDQGDELLPDGTTP